MLIIDTTKFEILKEEFVRPIYEIVSKIERTKVVHYKDLDSKISDIKIIISGTAIQDFEYLNYLEKFNFLKDFEGSVLGICAGAQIISLIFGGKLKDFEIIGVKRFQFRGKEMKAYFLITKIPILNENFEVLASLDDIPVIFKVKGKNIFGVLFNPEVYNREILEEFARTGRI